MKKALLIIFLLLFLYAPFIVVKPIPNYYRMYADLAKKYECYPIEMCKADFNGDGKIDLFTIVDEPNEIYRHYYWLKIFVEENNQPKEILNIRYDSIDDTYRTHIALFEQNGRKELIIYDTINKEKFFFWDGERLSPIWDGKTISPGDERPTMEMEIRKAMSFEDDTESLFNNIILQPALLLLFGLYYFVLLMSVGMYFYFQKKLKQKFYQ